MDILSKSFLTSVTFWGIVVSMLAQVAKHYGWTVDQDGLANELVSATASAIAIWGRFHSSQPLHVVTQTSTPVPDVNIGPPPPVLPNAPKNTAG